MTERQYLPPAKNTLPELKSDFEDAAAKGTHVNEVLTVSTAAMTTADASYAQF